jgi:hypothetical protein
MVMMQNVKTIPIEDSEAGMRSLRMSHAIVGVLLVLGLLKFSDAHAKPRGNCIH